MPASKRISADKVKASLTALLKPEQKKHQNHPYGYALHLQIVDHNCQVRQIAANLGIVL